MPDLAVRSTEAEWMDAADVPEDVFHACLADLAKANRWTLNTRPTLVFLTRALGFASRGTPFTLLDVGYGQGDTLRAIHRWATRRGLVPILAGIDLTPASATAARAATPAVMAIDYRTGDIFDAPAGERYDFIVSSLVTHHLDDDRLARFLHWQERTATRGWLVNDLHRHSVAYHGFKALSALMRWHPFVRHDGPLSVARSFRRADWEAIIAQAGLPRATIDIVRRFPFRLCLERLND